MYKYSVKNNNIYEYEKNKLIKVIQNIEKNKLLFDYLLTFDDK